MSIYTIENIALFKQDVKVSRADKLEYGEIYTPFSLIRQMLDLFDPVVFTDPQKRWLDIGAGQGYISMLLFAYLDRGLAACLPDTLKRKKHIVEKMLYMVELKDTNIVALTRMFGLEANIIHADFCTYDVEVQYDYIIGNPPYNAHGLKKVPTNKQQEKKADGMTLWTHFVRKSLLLLKPGTGQLCLIVPALWLKPDKQQIYDLLTSYQIEKIHCLSNTETNTIFKGEAQTPTCFFLLTNALVSNTKIQLYDKNRQAYVSFTHLSGRAIPLFGAHVIQKLQLWIAKAGALKVIKTNMPNKKSQFAKEKSVAYPYPNITTCILVGGLQPELVVNYSHTPQAFHGQPKLVLAHKMYGFPYWDQAGLYGIANRDNYVIVGKTPGEFAQLAAFLSTKLALYLYEAARYRMKYLEKYAFEFIPDITRLAGFPAAQEISDETVAAFFGFDADDEKHIKSLHRKNYARLE